MLVTLTVVCLLVGVVLLATGLTRVRRAALADRQPARTAAAATSGWAATEHSPAPHRPAA